MIPQFSLANLDALRSMLYGGHPLMSGGMQGGMQPSPGIQPAWGAQPPMIQSPMIQSPMIQSPVARAPLSLPSAPMQAPMQANAMGNFPNLMALRSMAPQAQNNLRMPMMRQF